jgi:hypothetical protein
MILGRLFGASAAWFLMEELSEEPSTPIETASA